MDTRRTLVSAKGVGVNFDVQRRRDDIKSISLAKLKANDKRVIWAIRDIDFQARKGDIIGIIGTNGAGKSTLCRVIANILRPDEGEISVYGEVSALLSMGTGFVKDLT